MNCPARPTQRKGEPKAPARARVPERFRRLKWNEVVWTGDFVADTVHIEGSTFLTKELAPELGSWPSDQFIIFVCHHGIRSLDAAIHFAGHDLKNARSMRGGIEAWSQEVDTKVPRYQEG